MTVDIEMGLDQASRPAAFDLEELLATRLLVQGNSGSGKSHLLRRLIERSARWVQQVIIDPEGDFVSLGDHFGHVVIDAADYGEDDILTAAARIREHRLSVVLNLEELEVEGQMRCAAAFLSGLFDAPRDHWYPVLVVVDEAQLFAPAMAGEVSDEARRGSLAAMTNLMCRGRKRGLAGVIATQRLAKLAKNVAAEASNFLMGRTFLDIDMARAADLLGMDRRQAEMFRDLERGQFVALGPAISRRPLPVRIGAVETAARTGSPKLIPLPEAPAEDATDMLFRREERAPRPAPPPPPQPVAVDDLIRSMGRPVLEPASGEPARTTLPPEEREEVITAVLADIVADPDSTYRNIAVLYQDFIVRCRMRRLHETDMDMAAFRSRLSMARAGVMGEGEDEEWARATDLARQLPEDLQGVVLMLAAAARNSRPCPSDDDVAEVYGTRSPARARRLLSYLEGQDVIVLRKDLRGNRTITFPALGWTTGPGEA